MIVNRFQVRCRCGELRTPGFDIGDNLKISGIPQWRCAKCSINTGGRGNRTYSDISGKVFKLISILTYLGTPREYDALIGNALKEDYKPC